jgi:hypothetical protein
VPATAYKLLRNTACLAGGVAAMALIVVVAVGSAFLAAALALSTVAGPARRRALARTTSTRHTPRPLPRPAPRAETAA